MNIQNRAFTLVELLVATTIISILATIAYLYFDWNVSDSRDSKRVADLGEIEKALEVYQTKKWSFPEPSNAINITYSGSYTAWTQGTFWKDTNKKIKVFWNEYPVDPLFWNEYSYSVTNGNREFQLWSLRENWDEEEGLWEAVLGFLGTSQVHADSIATAYIVGNYNGFMIKASDNVGIEYFIATPSIISNDSNDTDVVSIIENRKLVYNEFFNIPATYESFMAVDGWFNFNVSDPVIFSGDSDDLKIEQNLLDFNARLQYIYATTPTESFDKYIAVLEEEGLTSLKKFLTKTFKIPFRSYFNCKDILDDNASRWDGDYTIDSDGPGWEESYQVYCDMTTDGGWWTRVWDNHLENGDFSWGLWITNAVENDATTNNIVALSTPVDGNNYALHQIGNYSSNYEIPFDDPSLLKQWYELRMTMWRHDASEDTDVDPYPPVFLAGKSSCCTLWGSLFSKFTQKMNYDNNFWPGGLLTEIDISTQAMTDAITNSYLNGWILFDGFIGDDHYEHGHPPYADSEIELIDDWVQAGGFLLSTNDSDRQDPIGAFYNMPSGKNRVDISNKWLISDIDHPLLTNDSIGDLRGRIMTANNTYSGLMWEVLPNDIVLARDNSSPYLPTVILRKHGKWNILFTSDEWVFRSMTSGDTFDLDDPEDAFAAAIMTYAIETSAGVNPKEWYAFHNRLYYSDGTFSTNGQDRILETQEIAGQTWVKEQVRHRIYKAPESFSWKLWLDANNNKDLYFTGLRLELFYR